jgi:hypothetical protein
MNTTSNASRPYVALANSGRYSEDAKDLFLVVQKLARKDDSDGRVSIVTLRDRLMQWPVRRVRSALAELLEDGILEGKNGLYVWLPGTGR